MITLEHFEGEGGTLLRFCKKAQRASRRDAFTDLRPCPAGMHVEQGVDVKTLAQEGVDVDGIQLDKIACGSHERPLRRDADLPEMTALFHETLSLHHPLHGPQAHGDPFLLQQMMNDLAASSVLESECNDSVDDDLRKLPGMTVRTTALRGDDLPCIIRGSLDPSADGTRIEAGVAGDLADAATISDHIDGQHAESGELGIGGVRHT